MSTLTGSSEDKVIDAFNMETGQYESKLFTVDAHNHLMGNSDDIIDGTGVTNINQQNVQYILNHQGNIEFTAPGGFKWNFVVVTRNVPKVDPNKL